MSNDQSTTLFRVIALVPAAMLVLAVFHMPYGFYTLLRLVVTAAAVILTRHALSRPVRPFWAAAFCFIALLFNPVMPVHLTREIWFFIDFAIAAVFAGYIFVLAKQSS